MDIEYDIDELARSIARKKLLEDVAEDIYQGLKSFNRRWNNPDGVIFHPFHWQMFPLLDMKTSKQVLQSLTEEEKDLIMKMVRGWQYADFHEGVVCKLARKDGVSWKERLAEIVKGWEFAQWATAFSVTLLLVSVIGGARDNFMWRAYSLSYGYYTFLRLVVSLLCTMYTMRATFGKMHPILILIPATLAVLYQPIIKVEMEKGAWCWVNLLTIMALMFLSWSLRVDKVKRKMGS